jgi:hypothetical protein
MPAIVVQDSVLAEMAEAFHPLFYDYISPIGVYNSDGIAYPFGTGTFFQVGDHKFIVTAAHVFEEAKKYGAGSGDLCAFDFGEAIEHGTKLIDVPLEGQKVRLDGALDDVGVMRLSEKTISGLTRKRFLTLADVALWPEKPGYLWVAGFPALWCLPVSESVVSFHPLKVCAIAPSKADTAILGDYDEQIHFVVHFKRDSFERLDGEKVETPASYGGISGSAIWQSWWPSKDTATQWRSKHFKVVGVQTAVYPKSEYVKATTWRFVAHIMMKAYPKIRPAFELSFPGISQGL